MFYDNALFLPVTLELVPIEVVLWAPRVFSLFSVFCGSYRGAKFLPPGDSACLGGDFSFSIFETGVG